MRPAPELTALASGGDPSTVEAEHLRRRREVVLLCEPMAPLLRHSDDRLHVGDAHDALFDRLEDSVDLAIDRNLDRCSTEPHGVG